MDERAPCRDDAVAQVVARCGNSKSGHHWANGTLLSRTDRTVTNEGAEIIQNLPPRVSHPFWNLSIVHVIHGYAMLCFQVQRTPIIHAWGFCCTNLKFGNRAFSVA